MRIGLYLFGQVHSAPYITSRFGWQLVFACCSMLEQFYCLLALNVQIEMGFTIAEIVWLIWGLMFISYQDHFDVRRAGCTTSLGLFSTTAGTLHGYCLHTLHIFHLCQTKIQHRQGSSFCISNGHFWCCKDVAPSHPLPSSRWPTYTKHFPLAFPPLGIGRCSSIYCWCCGSCRVWVPFIFKEIAMA